MLLVVSIVLFVLCAFFLFYTSDGNVGRPTVLTGIVAVFLIVLNVCYYQSLLSSHFSFLTQHNGTSQSSNVTATHSVDPSNEQASDHDIRLSSMESQFAKEDKTGVLGVYFNGKAVSEYQGGGVYTIIGSNHIKYSVYTNENGDVLDIEK
ncbi:hypothetical protein [Alicyclobacillus macrosporangiidus]|uniref:hypothetical protein n=1 Tax=Alicyclobacillus macrosporangiidus TaxID=392015 RepID=UPI0011146376|nr:hypothetical protein [Alicyclobacillus macrosporangiidus]